MLAFVLRMISVGEWFAFHLLCNILHAVDTKLEQVLPSRNHEQKIQEATKLPCVIWFAKRPASRRIPLRFHLQ